MSDVSLPLLALTAFLFRADLSGATDLPPIRTEAGITEVVLGPDMPVALSGHKQSQRAELSETATSDDVNTAAGPVWVRFSVWLDPVTALPENGAKLHVAQFHQREGRDGAAATPALMLNLTEEGDLVAQFERAVGKRAYRLVAGGVGRDAALGQWIDIAIGADWRMAGGWTEILVRPEGAADWQSVAWDDGMNTSTGHVFFKFGLYRSFLERDPGLADRPARALFRTPVRGTDPRTVLGLAAAR